MFESPSPSDRDLALKRFTKQEIVARYRRKFSLGEEIGWDEVERHVELEGRLTDELLESTAETRAATFARVYSRLYSELPWLSGTGARGDAEQWAALLRPNSSVYEIGSGAGYLINYLAGKGFVCFASDISTERERTATSISTKVRWGATDGVHLTRTAEAGAFDFVISDQVVEHLHPDDILIHFCEARRLLKPTGRYIVRTPYALEGPADLSGIFGEDKPIFMHLHEFNYREMRHIKFVCGYRGAKAVIRYTPLSICVGSSIYMMYLFCCDRLIARAAAHMRIARVIKHFRKSLLLPRDTWVILEK
jgi:SAM-dependent methyltransferase